MWNIDPLTTFFRTEIPLTGPEFKSWLDPGIISKDSTSLPSHLFNKHTILINFKLCIKLLNN